MAQPPTPLVIVRMEDRGEAGRVAHVLVNNPEKRNALGRRGKEELIAAFEALAGDPDLRVAVLTGAGDRSFIGGADLAEMAGLDRAGAEDVSTKTHLACDAIRRLPVPVIARVNGYCLGAGMEIAASCDMRVGVESARFGMPEVKFGIPSGMEACLLPGLIGWGKTREMLLTGAMYSADDALAMSFVQKVAAAAELDAAVDRWLEQVCRATPKAVRSQKALMNRWERVSVDEGIYAGIDALSEAYTTGEPQAAIAAFFASKARRG